MRHNPPRGGPNAAPESGWRSPAAAAENWKACRRMIRLYGFAFVLAVALALGGVAHLLGYWKGYAAGVASTQRPLDPAPLKLESPS